MQKPRTLLILPLLIILLLQQPEIIRCELQATEQLKFYALKDSQKSLAVFKSNYSHKIDVHSILRDEYIFPSTILDNLHLSNTKDFEIHAGCGTFNHILVDKDDSLLDEIEFPMNGVQVFLKGDEDILFDASIETLSELFKFSRFYLKRENHFTFQSKFDQKKNPFHKFIYAQDPTDFICSDNIEKLKKYLPCVGSKGVFDFVNQTTLFQSKYVGIVLKVKITNDSVNFQLQVVSQFLNSQKDAIFNANKNVQVCPLVQKSTIISGNDVIQAKSKRLENTQSVEEGSQDSTTGTAKAKMVYKRLASIELPQINSITSSDNAQISQPSVKNILQTRRFSQNNWYYHNDALIHTIKNKSDKYTVELETCELLPYNFYPVFSQVQIIINGINLLQNDPYNKKLLSYERLSDKSVQFKINTVLLPNEEITIVIPMIKMMKSFENYPHDPQRGHDIIGAPILYRIINNDNNQNNDIHLIVAKNIVAWLPEPDFSMPFNIITYVCVLMGYIFLQIFRLSTEKVKSDGHDDNILKKILDLFRN